MQTNEILLIENSSHLNIRFEIFGQYVCMYVWTEFGVEWPTKVDMP